MSRDYLHNIKKAILVLRFSLTEQFHYNFHLVFRSAAEKERMMEGNPLCLLVDWSFRSEANLLPLHSRQYTHRERLGSSREESLSLNIIDYLFYFRFLWREVWSRIQFTLGKSSIHVPGCLLVLVPKKRLKRLKMCLVCTSERGGGDEKEAKIVQ